MAKQLSDKISLDSVSARFEPLLNFTPMLIRSRPPKFPPNPLKLETY